MLVMRVSVPVSVAVLAVATTIRTNILVHVCALVVVFFAATDFLPLIALTLAGWYIRNINSSCHLCTKWTIQNVSWRFSITFHAQRRKKKKPSSERARVSGVRQTTTYQKNAKRKQCMRNYDNASMLIDFMTNVSVLCCGSLDPVNFAVVPIWKPCAHWAGSRKNFAIPRNRQTLSLPECARAHIFITATAASQHQVNI